MLEVPLPHEKSVRQGAEGESNLMRFKDAYSLADGKLDLNGSNKTWVTIPVEYIVY